MHLVGALVNALACKTIARVTREARTCKRARRVGAPGIGTAIVCIECAFVLVGAGDAAARVAEVAQTKKRAHNFVARRFRVAVVRFKHTFVVVFTRSAVARIARVADTRKATRRVRTRGHSITVTETIIHYKSCRITRFTRRAAARIATKLRTIDIETIELTVAKGIGAQISNHINTGGEVTVGAALSISPKVAATGAKNLNVTLVNVGAGRAAACKSAVAGTRERTHCIGTRRFGMAVMRKDGTFVDITAAYTAARPA